MMLSTCNNAKEQLSTDSLFYNQLMADYTSWRVGGVAKKLFKPKNLTQLKEFLATLPMDENILWLGLGSNSLIRDSGISGTVILTQGNLADIKLIGGGLVYFGAGVACAKLARFCARCDLSGAEFWAGIPGTMGGALRMNAGCFNGETWDNIVEIETITRSGEIKKRTPADFSVSYRHVVMPADEWFIGATCKLPKGNKSESLQLIKNLLDRRSATQPTGEYSCGSVFRNPDKLYAAQLIESCGLKGMRIGGAVVSNKHANFILNENGSATAADIESLINFVQQEVMQKKDILLKREVHIFGDENVQQA